MAMLNKQMFFFSAGSNALATLRYALLNVFLSVGAVIDNLTATIVCVKILKRVVPHKKDWRHSCGGLTVVAANAGGEAKWRKGVGSPQQHFKRWMRSSCV